MGLNPVAQQLDTAHLEEHLHAKRGLVLAALSGAAHACIGRYFSIIHPLGGFCYGATVAISAWAINAIFRIANIDNNNPIAGLIKYYACTFISFAIGSVVTTAVGFPIKHTLGMALSLLTAASIMKVAVITALIAFAVIAVSTCIAVIYRMRRDEVTAQQAIEGLYHDIRPHLPQPVARTIENLYARIMENINRRRLNRDAAFDPQRYIAADFYQDGMPPPPMPQLPQPEPPRPLRAFQRYHEIENERQEMLRRFNEQAI